MRHTFKKGVAGNEAEYERFF
ncbi:hypothetical protein ROI_16090 [Roseburia intestinalis M50/1]|nr:hypothetical protein ROI_16090 [Roseburia intestinalis M50/1]